jgi:hypothetical protein
MFVLYSLKSPLACPERFGERGFRGVFTNTKNVDSSQKNTYFPKSVIYKDDDIVILITRIREKNLGNQHDTSRVQEMDLYILHQAPKS